MIANFGLAMLMFLAGYEIEFDRVKGTPLKLAGLGWLGSLLLGLAVGFLIHQWSFASLVLGLAFTTTALGTILPILADAGALPTRFGARVMAIGAVGEFGPIVAVALLLTSNRPLETGLFLVAFAVVTVLVGFVSVRGGRHPVLKRMMAETLSTSGQLAVRLSILTIVALLWAATAFGLDVLLGAFSAGVIGRLSIEAGTPEQREVVKSKLEAIGYGFLVPFFFVISGLRLDLAALTRDLVTILYVPAFLALFVIVRGLPVLILYRHEAESAERKAMALLSAAALSLVVVITTIGVQYHALPAATAAALVCAAMLSVLILPLAAMRLLPPEALQPAPGTGTSVAAP